MRTRVNNTKKRKHAIALEGSRVALTLARSCTSHIRQIFLQKYDGKYTFSSVVFTFDALLVIFAVLLCISSIVFFSFAPKAFDGGLRIESSVNEIHGSEEVPITLSIRSTNEQAHEHVRIRIQVPEWAEIIRTEPARDANGMMHFGTIEKNERVTAKLIIRSHVENVSMPIHFFAIQDDWTGFIRYIEGVAVHRVGESRLLAHVPSEATVIGAHAIIPFTVRNTASSRVPNVFFRILSSEGAQARIGDTNTLTIGAMEANESRTIFIDAYDVATSTIALHWLIQDGPQAATSGTSQMYIRSGSEKNNQDYLEKNNFLLRSEARYYSLSGDQIGVGPLPPKFGYTTTYWAAFVLGPTRHTLKNVVLTAELPVGVLATGKFSASLEANFLIKENKIEWHVPSIPLIGAEGVVFAYEVQFTPNASHIGAHTTLVHEGRGIAETGNGLRIFTTIPAILTGIIQP